MWRSLCGKREWGQVAGTLGVLLLLLLAPSAVGADFCFFFFWLDGGGAAGAGVLLVRFFLGPAGLAEAGVLVAGVVGEAVAAAAAAEEASAATRLEERVPLFSVAVLVVVAGVAVAATSGNVSGALAFLVVASAVVGVLLCSFGAIAAVLVVGFQRVEALLLSVVVEGVAAGVALSFFVEVFAAAGVEALLSAASWLFFECIGTAARLVERDSLPSVAVPAAAGVSEASSNAGDFDWFAASAAMRVDKRRELAAGADIDWGVAPSPSLDAPAVAGEEVVAPSVFGVRMIWLRN